VQRLRIRCVLAGMGSSDLPDSVNIRPPVLRVYTQNTHPQNQNYLTHESARVARADSAAAATTAVLTPSRIHHIFLDLHVL
jgi:hypothetical protein